MAIPEERKAELSKKRGAVAAGISDPQEKKKFIAAQGESESKGKGDQDFAGQEASANREEGNQIARDVLGWNPPSTKVFMHGPPGPGGGKK